MFTLFHPKVKILNKKTSFKIRTADKASLKPEEAKLGEQMGVGNTGTLSDFDSYQQAKSQNSMKFLLNKPFNLNPDEFAKGDIKEGETP